MILPSSSFRLVLAPFTVSAVAEQLAEDGASLDPNLLSTSLLITHWVVVLGISLRVIMRRRPVGVSVAWIAVVSSLPLAGALTYLLFGEARLGRERAARTAAGIRDVQPWLRALREPASTLATLVAGEAEPIRRQAESVLGFPALRGNELELFDDAERVFEALIDDIDDARSHCHLCFYVFQQKGGTAPVVDALARAARRGLRCRVLADAIGSEAFLSSNLAERLREAGVELVSALPTGPLRALFVRRDLRNHRKIVVIDDCVAYTGSLNLVDPHFFKRDAGVGEWVDAVVRVTGPTAAALGGVFALDWSVETGEACEWPQASEATRERTGASIVQVVPSGPDLRPQAIHQLLLTAIYSARRELVMTTPYFVPDEAILTALLSAAMRGVVVQLIVPARNDSRLVSLASAAHFDDLLSAGVRIALFEGGLLHSKSLTIDGETSIFGSVNLDMRSLWLNFEISLFIYDADFTSRLSALQRSYLASSRPLELEAWRERSATRRLTENAVRLLAPLL